jgi:hypothetical protein
VREDHRGLLELGSVSAIGYGFVYVEYKIFVMMVMLLIGRKEMMAGFLDLCSGLIEQIRC